MPAAIGHYVLPSPADIHASRMQRDALAQNLESLEQRGGKVDWKGAAGDPARLCIRVDRQAPVYGEKADDYVAKGIDVMSPALGSWVGRPALFIVVAVTRCGGVFALVARTGT